jgi:hypothetical protein
VAPTDIELAGAPRWSPADRERTRRGLADPAERIDEVGLPATHPWRGAMVEVVLPMDLQRLAGRISSLHANLGEASSAGAELRRLVNAEFGDSLSGYRRLVALGAIVGAVPECDQTYLVGGCWDTRRGDIDELVEAGEAYALARLALNGVLSDVAWTMDVTAIRQQIAAHGSSWLRWFATDWRRADALLRSLSAGMPLKRPTGRLAVLDRLISGQRAEKILDRDNALGGEAFGRYWRGERSDWSTVRSITDWVVKADAAGLGNQARQSVAGIGEPAVVGNLSRRLVILLDAVDQDLHSICTTVALAVDDAFGAATIDAVRFPDLVARCASWLDGIEALPKWIAYRGQAKRLRELGLGEFVDRLADGRLRTTVATDEIDMAYYEAVLRAMATSDPEILAFDGHTHTRKVDEFRRLDLLRITLARLEVAASHDRGVLAARARCRASAALYQPSRPRLKAPFLAQGTTGLTRLRWRQRLDSGPRRLQRHQNRPQRPDPRREREAVGRDRLAQRLDEGGPVGRALQEPICYEAQRRFRDRLL